MATAQIIRASAVGKMLGCTAATFLNKRRQLEADHNFPPKTPGTNGWSRPAVERWIETNGQTYMPPQADDQRILDAAASTLEREYGRGA